MQSIKDYKAEVLDRLDQLIGVGKEKDIFPVDLKSKGIDFEMINSMNVIVAINETDVTYTFSDDEPFQTEFPNLAIEDIGELINILEEYTH